MSLNRKIACEVSTVIACILCLLAGPASGAPADNAAITAAICPIVYPVDQYATDRGYHFLFYGDGFFVNEQGYLITAAHVLSQLHGGQPYVLLRQSSGPARIVMASLVGVDRDHDVAVLRVTPNPFEGNYKVGFLPLAENWVTRGRAVLAAATHPSKPLDAYTLDPTVDDRSSGEVFDFQFSQLDKRRNDTELFLFNHQVRRGQSGGPIISPESGDVVGLVEGQWLRSSLISLASATDQATPGVGAAVPIHYAISLLQQRGIPWHTASNHSESFDNAAGQATVFSTPAPLSLVASPYPSRALLGGEVVLDALIDVRGRLVDIKVVRGESPFLEKVISAVRTWSFFPASLDGHAVAARIGITFQFSQSYERMPATLVHKYDEPSIASTDRGPLPVATVEPEYPITSVEDGSVILYELVGPQGGLTSVHVIRDSGSLSAPALAAANQWSFVPGRRSGKDTDSAVIVVVVFRHSRNTQSVGQKK